MKRSTINAALFSYFFSLVFCSLINAQSNRFLVGVTGGAGLSKFDFSNTYYDLESKQKFGYSGGISLGIEFNRFALLTGAQYTARGSKYATENLIYLYGDNYEFEGLGFDSFDERNTYISIPLLVRYRFLGENFGITLSMGPKINVGLSSKIHYETTTSDGGYEDYLKSYGERPRGEISRSLGSGITNEYQKTQTSFTISPGILFSIGESGRLGVNVVFDFGTGNMFNERYAETLIDSDISQKMNTTELTITYEHSLNFGDKY